MKYLNRFAFFFFVSIFFISSGLIYAQSESGSSSNKNSKNFWEKITITAEVDKIDQKNHEVTLKDQNGDEITFVVDKNIDLSNIKKGDSVKAQYFRSIALNTAKATAEQEKEDVTIIEKKTFSPAGIDIGGEALKQIKALVTVKSIDSTKNELTVTGPKNKEYKITVPNKNMLKNLQEGAKVVVEYTESLATSLEKLK